MINHQKNIILFDHVFIYMKTNPFRLNLIADIIDLVKDKATGYNDADIVQVFDILHEYPHVHQLVELRTIMKMAKDRSIEVYISFLMDVPTVSDICEK